ncbi:hypothetical protein CLAFUW4_06736, partial [Fulvia fulva]
AIKSKKAKDHKNRTEVIKRTIYETLSTKKYLEIIDAIYSKALSDNT